MGPFCVSQTAGRAPVAPRLAGWHEVGRASGPAFDPSEGILGQLPDTRIRVA